MLRQCRRRAPLISLARIQLLNCLLDRLQLSHQALRLLFQIRLLGGILDNFGSFDALFGVAMQQIHLLRLALNHDIKLLLSCGLVHPKNDVGRQLFGHRLRVELPRVFICLKYLLYSFGRL